MYSNKTPDSGNQKKMGHFELNLKKRKMESVGCQRSLVVQLTYKNVLAV